MSYSNPEWDRFRQWKRKKDLLHFFMKWGGNIGEIAWHSLRKTNRDNPDLRAFQKY